MGSSAPRSLHPLPFNSPGEPAAPEDQAQRNGAPLPSRNEKEPLESHFLITLHVHKCMLSHFIVAHQASLSMALSRQEYWSGLPRPPPTDLPDPGVEPVSPSASTLQAGFLWRKPNPRCGFLYQTLRSV